MKDRSVLFFGTLILSLAIALTAAVVADGSSGEDPEGFFYDDIYYEVTGPDTVTLDRRCSTTPEITIPKYAIDPESQKSFEVTKIEDSAFGRDEDLRVVNFGEGCAIVHIGEYAFVDCFNLKTVHLEALGELDTIDRHAFDGCHSIEEITFPANTNIIWDYAFNGCRSLERISFVDGCLLDTIMDQAFCYCTALEEIVFCDSVRYIGPNAFAACNYLKSVTFPEGTELETLDIFAFADCDSLTDVYFPELKNFDAAGKCVFGYTDGFQEYECYFANTYGGERFLLKDVDASVFENARYHRDAGSDVFTRAYDVTFDGYSTSIVYAGQKLERPAAPVMEGKAFTGWYLGDRCWDFENDIVVGNMTLVPKWADITDGSVSIEAVTEADVSLVSGLDSVSVSFANGKTVMLDTTGMTGNLRISSHDIGVDRFELTTVFSDGTPYAGEIIVSFEVDASRGEPTVYLYEGDVKVEIESFVIGGTLYFQTGHNSVYGVEYSSVPASDSGPYWMIIVLVAVILIGIVMVIAVARRE